MTEKWAIKIIRDYHELLLDASNGRVELEGMLKDSPYMDARWKRDVGILLKKKISHQQEHAMKIQELRKEFNYLGY